MTGRHYRCMLWLVQRGHSVEKSEQSSAYGN